MKNIITYVVSIAIIIGVILIYCLELSDYGLNTDLIIKIVAVFFAILVVGIIVGIFVKKKFDNK